MRQQNWSSASGNWRRLVWFGLLISASVAFSLGLACATPFAAFGAAAALTLLRRDALVLVTSVWFANQLVGFTMLEAGFCRSRETVNVLVECVVDTCLCGILFYAIGFAFMFSHGNGFIGYHWFFLQNAPARDPLPSSVLP